MMPTRGKIFAGLFVLLIAYSAGAFSQNNDAAMHLKVLRKNIIGKEFRFGNWQKNGMDETRLIYLGKFKMRNGQAFKVMSSFVIWGLAGHGRNATLIFTNDDQYIGCYYPDCLATRLNDGKLIFVNTLYDCNATTIIDLRNGLPEEIFLKCKGQNGDIPSFIKENQRIPVKVLKGVH